MILDSSLMISSSSLFLLEVFSVEVVCIIICRFFKLFLLNGENVDKYLFTPFRYLMALDKYPVITKAITSALLTLIGDLICQVPSPPY